MIFVRGFILTALALLLKQVPVVTGQCGSFAQITHMPPGGSGSIKSPSYPYTYGSNKNCKWRIVAPPNHKVLIYFTFFDLEACCSCDYVQIHDGPGSYSNISQRACGRNLPKPVYSSGSNLYVFFHSDSSIQKKGFVAHFKALSSQSGCPSIDPTASVGVIYSPNFPWNYPDYEKCYWNITAPSWKMITLTFIHFDIKRTYYGSCNIGDYVEVQKSYSNRQQYCGTRHYPFTLFSYGYLSVAFFSDSSVGRSGFMAFYQKETSYASTAYTTYPYYPTTSGYSAVYTCSSYHSERRIHVGTASGSITIQSSNNNPYYNYPTISSRKSCSWEIDTAEGYFLELTFTRMSISSCSGRCSCGHVQVYEESNSKSSSSSSLLGTYCNGHYPRTVITTSNKMSVSYYGYYSYDSFRATVIPRKVKSKAAAIAVPIVIAVVLFAIIFAVIKFTKVKRSAGPAESSTTSFNGPVLAPSSQNAEAAPPSYQEGTPLPLSVDLSQGVTNMSMIGGTGHM